MTIELEDGDACLVVRLNGEKEIYVPNVEDDDEVSYDSPMALITKAAMAINDVEIATMLQAKLEADLQREAEADRKSKD